MRQPTLFSTPMWTFSAPVPDGAKEWALGYKKANYPNLQKWVHER